MRVHAVACAAVVAATLLATPAFAATDLFDTYTPGSIVGQTGPTPPWTTGETWDTAGVATATISGGALQVAGTNDRGNAWRRYDDSALGLPYQIEFSVTLNELDSLIAGGFQGDNDTNAGDYVNIFERGGDDSDFGGNGSWLIRGGRLNANGDQIVRGTATNSNQNAYNETAPFNFYAFNYDPLVANGFTDADVVDTGIAMTEGTTYDFTVSFLGDGLWNLAIDNGSTTYDSSTTDGPFGFRSASPTPQDGTEAPAVHFGYTDTGSGADATEAFQLTVNSFTIPDPFVAGDVNGDGLVNIDDFNPILANFAKPVVSRDQGDLDNNNFVDLEDFRIWKDIFTASGGSLIGLDLGPFSVQVPEPSTAGLFSIATMTFAFCVYYRKRNPAAWST